MTHMTRPNYFFYPSILVFLGIGVACSDTSSLNNQSDASITTDSSLNFQSGLSKKAIIHPLNNTCQWARDGICDEPVNCVLGTDSTDCVAACTDEKMIPFVAAACEFRNPTKPPIIDPSVGTGGKLHLTGHRDGIILVPSGADLSTKISRHYRLFIPSSYNPARPTPLVINMAGHRVNHYVLADVTQLQRTADMNRFIVVYPEQEFRKDLRWAWWTDWNWTKYPKDNPDLYFLRELIQKIEDEYNIDRTRIYATGHSRGAALSIIAALELPDLIAGACTQSGFTEFEYDERIKAYNGRKVPMVFIHGVLDTDIPINYTGNVEASDSLVKILKSKGWTDKELVYYRLENVGHRWQPQLNQQWWDFLSAQPLPLKAQP